MPSVAIIGGGPAGVVVAHELSSMGIIVDLLEKAPELGGLHHSVALDGVHFDTGSFLFYPHHELLLTFPFLRDLFVPVEQKALKITPGGCIDRYGLSLRGYVAENGLLASAWALADLLYCRVRYRRIRHDSVRAYLRFVMGDSAYQRSGLKGYIERLHGVKDSEVGWEFVHQRLHHVGGYAFINRVRRAYWRRASRRPSPVLARPREGFSRVYSLIRQDLERQGVCIRTGVDLRSVIPIGGAFEVRGTSISQRYRRIVSTIPIPVMLALVGAGHFATYKQRSLLSLFYRGRVRFDATELYNFSAAGFWKRIVVFSKLYGRVGGDDYFTVEVTVDDVDEGRIHLIRCDFERHMQAMKLVDPDLRLVGHFVTPRAFPVFCKGDTDLLRRDRDALKRFGIDFVGRQGAFEYLSSDAAAAKARQLAHEIAESL